MAIHHMRIALGIGLVATTGLVLSSASLTQNPRDQRPEAPPPRQKLSSVVELRAKTGDERIRAEHFNMEGFSLLEEGSVVIPHEEQPTAPPPAGAAPPPVDPKAWLVTRVCSSDAVVLGHATGEHVLLNRNETFLFTDYVIAVEKWIRPQSRAERITASMMGGEVELAGRVLTANHGPRLYLQRPYILFLHQLAGTSGFVFNAPPLSIDTTSFTVTPEASTSQVGLSTFLKTTEDVAAACRAGN